MFSWIKSFFKAKPPAPTPKRWGIYVNGHGEYSVKYLLGGNIYCPPNLNAANLYFKNQRYGNVLQCENAIADWENAQELNKKKPVRYLY